jgi:hypothetical protein
MTVDSAPSTTSSTNSTNGAKVPFFEVRGDKPVNYGILLFPSFQALDVFGPLDVLPTLPLLLAQYPHITLRLRASFPPSRILYHASLKILSLTAP